MNVEILEEKADILPEYEKISIAFEVRTHFRVELADKGLGGVRLVEEPITPYLKDYDEFIEDRPSVWGNRFDISNWGILSALVDGKRIGGAAVAWKTPALFMLDGRDDLAALWDLRVAPEYRGRGIGRRLFERAAGWAKARSCRRLRVETQNVNVPACRFYLERGCELGSLNRFAYPELPGEIQLIWEREL